VAALQHLTDVINRQFRRNHTNQGEVEGSWCGERVLSTCRSASCHLGAGHRATHRSIGCFFQSRDAMDRRARPPYPPIYFSAASICCLSTTNPQAVPYRQQRSK
jgi:hypothetical protein